MREEFKRICQKHEDAVRNYQDYVKQFFTKGWNGKIIQRATKMLDCDGIKEIKKLRKEMEIAKKELRQFFVESYSYGKSRQKI